MKRILTLVLSGLFLSGLQAQSISDVTALSNADLLGTARYRALSGAFGALGGDLSALNNNPAASAVFNYSSFTFTGAAYYKENTAFFGSGIAAQRETNYEINQAGGVLVFKNNNKTGFRKISLGFNYDIQNNFDNDIFIAGNGNQSVADYFAANANGFSTNDLSVLDGESVADAYINIGNSLGFAAQQGFLGYQAFVIDPAANSNNSYVSNATLNNGVQQEQRILTSGTDSKFTLNLGGQYNENLYMGVGLNLHAVNRRTIIRFDEFDYAPDSFLQYTQFDNELYTFGSGFSANAGFIAKLGNSLRVGGSYQTPTWYDLGDELWQGINTDILNSTTDELELVEVYPDVIYRFPDYSIRLPSKWMASGAFVLGNAGLISAEYTFQDMSNAQLRPTSDPFFAEQNFAISQELRAVSTFRLGAEMRAGRWSFRGGYRFEESPYRNQNSIGDLTGYSLGLGVDFGGSALDFAWSGSQRDINQTLYPGLLNTARIDEERSDWVLSYTVKF